MPNANRAAQSGFSMIEIIVTAGLMGIVILGITAINKVGFMGQKTIQAQDDARSVTDAIGNLLSNQTACLNTLAGLNPTASNPSGASLTTVKDQGNAAQFVVGNVYGNRSLKLNGMVLGGAGTDAKSGQQKWVSTGAGQGTAFLALEWLQTGNQASGVQQLNRFVLVNVSINGSNQITGCMAIVGNVASSGMGTAGYLPVWTTSMNLGNSVVFQDGGSRIGIGTATPAFRLDTRFYDGYTAGYHKIATFANSQGNYNGISLGYLANGINDEAGFVAPAAMGGSGTSLVFATPYLGNVTERMRINTFGNIGIGTSNPQRLFHVHGGASYGMVHLTNNTTGSQGNDGVALYNAGADAYLNNYEASNFYIYNGNAMAVTINGQNVGIGTSPSSAKLHVQSAANMNAFYAYTPTSSSTAYAIFGASASGANFGAARGDGYAYVGWGHGYLTANSYAAAFFHTSDERLKEQVRPIEDPLGKLLSLRGVKFRWKKDGREDIGFLAQEAEKVVPELVKEVKDMDDKGGGKGLAFKHMAYGNVVALVVEAVREIWARITSHDDRLERLERENALLRERLERLEEGR